MTNVRPRSSLIVPTRWLEGRCGVSQKILPELHNGVTEEEIPPSGCGTWIQCDSRNRHVHRKCVSIQDGNINRKHKHPSGPDSSSHTFHNSCYNSLSKPKYTRTSQIPGSLYLHHFGSRASDGQRMAQNNRENGILASAKCTHVILLGWWNWCQMPSTPHKFKDINNQDRSFIVV